MNRKELQEILIEVSRAQLNNESQKIEWAFQLIWRQLSRIEEVIEYCRVVEKMGPGIVFGQGTAEDIRKKLERP